MAYPWANDMLYRVMGNTPPPRQTEGAVKDRGQDPKKHHATNTVTNLDPLFAAAGAAVPGWRTITLRLQNPDAAALVFQVDRGDGGRPDLRSQITVDAASGHILRMESFQNYNRGRQMRIWVRFTHTGEAGGIAGETIAGVASLGAAILCWTGISLAIRRFFSWRRRVSARSGLAPDSVASR
jgi:uncharacterized iron-regulated membrane protein